MDNDFEAIRNSANEDANLAGDSLAKDEEDKLAKEHRKAIKIELHKVVVMAIRLGAIMIFILLVIRLWHIAAPSDWRWLSEVDIQGIDKMLFSSAFGGFVLSYLKEVISGKY